MEPNFASLLSADEPTAAEQAAAWAKALRQKQALAGTLSLAGGDLAPAGALQERSADAGQAQLMHAMGQRQAKAQQLSEYQQKQLQHLQEFAYKQQHDAASLDEQRRAHEATLALANANLGLASRAAERGDQKEARNEEKYRNQIAGLDIPFQGGVFKGRPGIDPQGVKVDRVTLGHFEQALGGMDSVEKALHDVVGLNPLTEPLKFAQATAHLNSLTNDVGDTLSVAYGQGKQSMFGQHKMEQQLGADLSTPLGVAAFIKSMSGDPEEAKRLITTKVNAARRLTHENALATMKTRNMPYIAPEDAKAIEWAKGHAGDPKAAAILQMHGIQQE